MSEAHSSPYLAHHFDRLEQQSQSAVLGMWLFLTQEIMFFGGIFLGYVFYRVQFPDAFMAGSYKLSIGLGSFNTVVLIGSSLTMALAVRSAQLGHKQGIQKYLLATLFLGCVFLGVKVVEYSAKFEHHLIPGHHFTYHGGGKFVLAGHPEETGGMHETTAMEKDAVSAGEPVAPAPHEALRPHAGREHPGHLPGLPDLSAPPPEG